MFLLIHLPNASRLENAPLDPEPSEDPEPTRRNGRFLKKQNQQTVTQKLQSDLLGRAPTRELVLQPPSRHSCRRCPRGLEPL